MQMDYWNQKNFEGLDALAAQLHKDERLSLLGGYCRLRSAGRRQEAFRALDGFLVQAEKLPTKAGREVINLIYELAFRTPDVHQFISNPLDTRFLQPGLKNWLSDEPNSVIALRWDGIFNENATSLMNVLALDPRDTFVRRRLIAQEVLALVEDALHHIHEGGLLMDLPVIETLLEQGENWVRTAPDPSHVEDLKQRLSERRRLIADWKEFEESGASSFPDWCAENDRHHEWDATYSYKR